MPPGSSVRGASRLQSLDGPDHVDFDDALSVGRHPHNDLVLGHARVSSRHAVIEWSPAGWRLRDLGSRNGTTVNDRKIRGWRSLRAGDVVRFGGVSAWRVASLRTPDEAAGVCAFLEFCVSGRREPVRSDRYLVGTGAPCDATVEEWLADPGSPIRLILFEEAGLLWLQAAASAEGVTVADGAAGDEPVQVDEPVEVTLGPTPLRVIPVTGGVGLDTTERAVRKAKAYDLDLHLDFDGPGEGTIRVVEGGREWTVHTGQRFVLLVLLARAGGEWVDDEALKVGLWGKVGATQVDRSALRKLIHDTRQLFVAHGVDGWFIDKLSGRTRLRLLAARIHLRERF